MRRSDGKRTTIGKGLCRLPIRRLFSNRIDEVRLPPRPGCNPGGPRGTNLAVTMEPTPAIPSIPRQVAGSSTDDPPTSGPVHADSEERKNAFLAVLERYRPALRRIARVYAGVEAEDLFQEIVLQLWRGLPDFRGESGVGTWLYRVALNTGLKHRRRLPRRATQELEQTTVAESFPSEEALQARILGDFLDSLRALDRAVLLLYLDALPHEQIGEVIGLSPNAVAVRIHRIKARYRERYLE